MPETNTETLASILAVDDTWKKSRNSTVARYEGIAQAKQHALAQSKSLLTWGRWLSWGVIFVSAIHIWESVSRIAPASIGVLHLHKYVYWGASLLFTILIDVVAVYILKANTVLAYTGTKRNRSIWFFYALTALLNAAFIAANSPDATAILRAGIIEGLGNIFLILLPITVPVSMWAIESQNQRLEAGNIMLSVDIATLKGIIIHANTAPITINNTANTVHISGVSASTIDKVLSNNETPDRVLPLQSSIGVIEATMPVIKSNCQKCGALLPDLGDARRNNMKWVSTARHGCTTCKS